MKRLYYFTDSYPFSEDYTWKSAEIKEAAKVFSEVIIVPFTFKKDNTFEFPENVRIVSPTLGDTLYAKPKYLGHVLSYRQPQRWISEFFKALGKGKEAVTDWYLATVYSNIILKKPIFKELKTLATKENSVLFFQWTMNNALLIPKLRQWGFKTIVCRMHGFDLYEFRHHEYLPYKKRILEGATCCTFISEHGLNYAKERYPFIEDKARIDYLGSKAFKENKRRNHGTFHLLSIARVVPLKRLHLIAKALCLIDFELSWTHIGDGYAMKALTDDIRVLNSSNTHVNVELLGWQSPEEIEVLLEHNAVDCLILVSETEGLPVAIMEAFSASIPVIATDVGGISEIVKSNNGVLLDANPSAEEVANAIATLYKESDEQKELRRRNALNTYTNSFDLSENSASFVRFLNTN